MFKLKLNISGIVTRILINDGLVGVIGKSGSFHLLNFIAIILQLMALKVYQEQTESVSFENGYKLIIMFPHRG